MWRQLIADGLALAFMKAKALHGTGKQQKVRSLPMRVILLSHPLQFILEAKALLWLLTMVLHQGAGPFCASCMLSGEGARKLCIRPGHRAGGLGYQAELAGIVGEDAALGLAQAALWGPGAYRSAFVPSLIWSTCTFIFKSKYYKRHQSPGLAFIQEN